MVIMCGLVIFTQLLFIIFALYLPLNFILSMLPTYNGLLKKAVLKLFNTILMRAGLTLLITIAFSLSAMIYSMSGDYPFLMVVSLMRFNPFFLLFLFTKLYVLSLCLFFAHNNIELIFKLI